MTSYEDPATLGVSIHIARISRELTMSQIAKEAEVSIGWLSNLEKGKMKQPNMAKVARVDAAINSHPCVHANLGSVLPAAESNDDRLQRLYRWLSAMEPTADELEQMLDTLVELRDHGDCSTRSQ